MKSYSNRVLLKVFVCVLICILLFFVDIYLELGIAFGVNYVFFILLSVWMGRKSSFILAAIATLFILLGWSISPSGGDDNIVLLNRLFSILAVWAVAFVIEHFLKTNESRAKFDKTLGQLAKRRFLVISTITFLIGSFILIAVYMFQANLLGQDFIRNQQKEFTKVEEDVENSLIRSYEDLLFLSRLENVKSFESREIAVANDFSDLCGLRGAYDQIRILGNNGDEKLRVNYNLGIPSIVPKDKLQDKSQSSYFKKSVGLMRDEIYISSIEANRENGKIEIPVKPVIRFVTPIFKNDRSKGILVINYLADDIFEQIYSNEKIRTDQGVLILDQDGFLIAGTEGKKELKFKKPDSKAAFPVAEKDFWERTKSQKSGGFYKDENYYLFTRVDFLDVFREKSHGKVGNATSPSIVILRTIPKKNIVAHKHVNFKLYLTYFCLYVVVFIMGVLLLWNNLKAKQRAENKFQSLFNETFQFIGLVAIDGTLLEANNSLLNISKNSRQEILGKKFWDIPFLTNNELEKERMEESIRSAGNGEFVRYEIDLVQGEGVKTIDLSLRPVFDEKGSVEYIIPEGRDISKMKALQRKLITTNELFEEVQEVARIGSWRVDLDKNIAHWSNVVYDIHEVERGEKIKVEEGINFYREDFRPIIQEAIEEAIGNNRSWDVEAVLVTTSNKEIWVRAIGYPVFIKGELKELRGLFMDIDTAKREGIKLREGEKQIKKLNEELERKVVLQLTELNRTKTELEQQLNLIDSNAIITIRDLDLQWSSVNHHFCQISGYSSGELIGRNYDFLNADENVQISQEIGVVVSKGEVWKGEIHLRRKDGAEYWVNSFIKPFFDEEGSIERYVEVSFDITTIKESEERILTQSKKLEHINKELELVNKELETFSYSVSHDLKAPLRALQGFSKNLQKKYDDILDETGKRWLEFIASNAERMDSLIKSILSFSRINKQQLVKTEIDMENLVRDKVEEEKLTYKSEFDVTIGKLPIAFGDNAMIDLVWQNLIGNAFKYSHKNELVKIEISGKELEDFLEYSVKDNGVGFDMRHYDSVFGLFQRAHANDEFEGTGVGLANVVRIISKHGGEINAYSEPGKGAQFTFKIPKR